GGHLSGVLTFALLTQSSGDQAVLFIEPVLPSSASKQANRFPPQLHQLLCLELIESPSLGLGQSRRHSAQLVSSLDIGGLRALPYHISKYSYISLSGKERCMTPFSTPRVAEAAEGGSVASPGAGLSEAALLARFFR